MSDFAPGTPLAEDPAVQAYDRGFQEGYDSGYGSGYEDGAEDAFRSVADDSGEDWQLDAGRLIATLERMRGGP